MTVVYPEGTPTLGNVKVIAVASVADIAAPTTTELAAGVDLSCYLMADGWNPAATQGKGTRARRLCSTRNRETLNPSQWSGPTLRYTHDPQANDAADGNEARELLQEGALLYFFERQGLDAQDDAIAAAERGRVHYLELGEQFEMGDPNDENGEFFVMQETAYVNDGPVTATVAAGA